MAAGTVSPPGNLGDPVATALAVAADPLFPDALAIDAAPVVPTRYFDLLASGGLYGLYGPASAGGFDADLTTGGRVVEALAGASLATAFVWLQHHGVVRAMAEARAELRDRWLRPLCQGRVRAGVAAAGALRRAGPPAVTAEPDGDGWRLHGTAPWVTGWQRIDVVHVAARHDDRIVWALIDAVPASTLEVRPLELAACRSTATVELALGGHPVGPERVVAVEAYDEWRAADARGLRPNGYLAVGVAARCAGLLRSSALAAEVDAVRAALDRAEGPGAVAARAEATVLAVRAASALVVAGGGHAVDLRSEGQRLAREAMFLLVFAQTTDIRAAQLDRLVGHR